MSHTYPVILLCAQYRYRNKVYKYAEILSEHPYIVIPCFAYSDLSNKKDLLDSFKENIISQKLNMADGVFIVGSNNDIDENLNILTDCAAKMKKPVAYSDFCLSDWGGYRFDYKSGFFSHIAKTLALLQSDIYAHTNDDSGMEFIYDTKGNASVCPWADEHPYKLYGKHNMDKFIRGIVNRYVEKCFKEYKSRTRLFDDNGDNDYNPTPVEVFINVYNEDKTPKEHICILRKELPRKARERMDILPDELCLSKKIGWESRVLIEKDNLPAVICFLLEVESMGEKFSDLLKQTYSNKLEIIGYWD